MPENNINYSESQKAKDLLRQSGVNIQTTPTPANILLQDIEVQPYTSPHSTIKE